MLRVFRKNSPFTPLLLFIFAIVVKLRALLVPVLPKHEPGHFLYNYILRSLEFVLGRSAFAHTMLAVIVLFVQALYLNSITIRHKLFPRNTFLPAFVYLLLTSIYPRLNQFSETLIINWLLLGAMDIMFGFSRTTQPRTHIYNAAILLSLAGIFQMSMLALFFLLIIGMVLFRTFNLGEWAVALLGYGTPFYFLLSILFLVDKTYLLRAWPRIGISAMQLNASPLIFTITLVVLAVLLLAGFAAMQRNVSQSNIYVRRNWTGITFYLILTVAIAVFTEHFVPAAWLLILPPFSFIVTHVLILEKNKRFSNFIFYFSLAFLVFCLVFNI